MAKAKAKANVQAKAQATTKAKAQAKAQSHPDLASVSGTLTWPAYLMSLDEFLDTVRAAGRTYWRDLPWRNIDDAYAVLVSEIMLQQTQVARVLRYWERFIDAFPTLDALAAATNADVLEMWQGLGYNRRALALKRTADVCAAENGGCLPKTVEELLRLPGIGPATAAGVVAFAYNAPATYLETNVRTVFLHCLFPERDKVSDKEIMPLVELSCPADNPRAWYYALLDYGAHLKSILPNPARRSAHHVKQSTFEGSRRQKRAELVRIVLGSGTLSTDAAFCGLNELEACAGRECVEREVFDSLVCDLAKEGFFTLENDEILLV